METFADIVNRLIPRSISLARLSREANIEYSYFHGLMQGHRTFVKDGAEVERTLRASPTKGLQTLDALAQLGVRVTQEDRERMVTACLPVPEGFKLITDVEGSGGAPEPSDYNLSYTSKWEQLTGGEKRMFGKIIEAWTEWKFQQVEDHESAGESGQQPIS